jgi:SAM-dependent methyltransferase
LNKEKFLTFFEKSVLDCTFVKLTLSSNKGFEADLKNIYIKSIKLKNEPYLSFTYRYKTKDIVKNYPFSEAKNLLVEYLGEIFQIANLFSTENNISYSKLNNGKDDLKITKSTHNQAITEIHDIQKNRKIASDSNYLKALGIADADGNIFKNGQDKYKQINHFVELLSPLIKELPKRESYKVVDMGSGKGYLTFALYDYLTNILNHKTEVIGVEYRPDMVQICNEIAQKADFTGLSFEKGTIIDYETESINILIALHACDTATDDAIYKGIKANADLIVVAPCCHKQIRKEIEKNKAKNELGFLTKHGIFMERQAEMVTDGLRSLLLEFAGYSVNIQQFISDAHTAKNIMITAVRKEKLENRIEQTEKKQQEILGKIKNIKTYFGIEIIYLEKLFGH